jgi:two-component system, chemotaxis family, chemotaxis protein CheY
MQTTVLVVDDSALARKMLIASLPPSWDVSVSQAANGEEAVKAHREGKVDYMFLDLTMPVMDGFQVLEALKTEGIKCPVFVVSADIQPTAQERVRQLGAVAFVQKPVNPAKISGVLKAYGVAL